MDINERIKSRRLELGLTLKDVSEMLGVAESTISRYESTDIKNMGIDKLQSLASALKTSPAYLMGWPERESARLPSPSVDRLLGIVHLLNGEGQEKVCDYADDLLGSGKYACYDNTLNFEEYTEAYTIGAAAAGSGFAYGDPDEQHRLFMTTELPPHDFSVDVKGDSMFPTIVDGDVVFVKKDCYQQDGKIYVLDIDGETVVKRVYFEPDQVTLVSDNPEWDDRIVTGAELERTRVLGEVIGWETPIR